MSSLTRTFYPITALLGVAGYYETTTTNLFESLFVLLLCGCLAALILVCRQRSGKEKKYHGK
jgi:bacitracin transport system permease protein